MYACMGQDAEDSDERGEVDMCVDCMVKRTGLRCNEQAGKQASKQFNRQSNKCAQAVIFFVLWKNAGRKVSDHRASQINMPASKLQQATQMQDAMLAQRHIWTVIS